MITTFGRVVARKGVKQRLPELTEKESLLVDVDFIGPILDQSGKEFSQIFLGRWRARSRLATERLRSLKVSHHLKWKLTLRDVIRKSPAN